MLKLVQVGRILHAGYQQSLRKEAGLPFLPIVSQYRTKYNKKVEVSRMISL